jgi:hypothetical protein
MMILKTSQNKISVMDLSHIPLVFDGGFTSFNITSGFLLIASTN